MVAVSEHEPALTGIKPVDVNAEDVEGSAEDDEDEDDEEEAEEIARRLKEQLWADISKAQAAQATERIRNAQAPPAIQTNQLSGPGSHKALSKKESAALETMRSILALTAKDPEAQSTLSATLVPGLNDSMFGVLIRTVHDGAIPSGLAKILSPLLVSLARSDALFATMRNSNIPAVQLDRGKRQREESDEEQRLAESRSFKRPILTHSDVERQITEAIQVVSNALSANTASSGGSLSPSIISTIQLQLHQIFLFAMTSSTRGGQEMHALQEIGGLIQVIGVLSGTQIGPTAPSQGVPVPTDAHASSTVPFQPPSWIPLGINSPPSRFSEIGTAVYPCLIGRCRKTFYRLFSLRAHQRIHAVHRPFRCTACPASFSRNHDLKRHAKLHEKKGWQCAGCDKMFSRRDAIKRHKNSSAVRGGKGELCVNAAIREVEVDRNGDEDFIREGRRTKMWTDIVTNSVGGYPGYGDHGGLEDGEVHNDIIQRMQDAVLSLHPTLQAHVSRALGTDHAAPPLHLDPTGGQATLAGVIARAQMQNMASQFQPPIRQPDTSQDLRNVEQPLLHSGGDLVESARPQDSPSATRGPQPCSAISAPQLSLYGLSEEQRTLLEQAIANAASAAQAQAEAEAALEEDEDGDERGESDPDEGGESLGADPAPPLLKH
ncbi:hypothetical protein J3A83DRAFT_2608731 [Scleroderma citrinum]